MKRSVVAGALCGALALTVSAVGGVAATAAPARPDPVAVAQSLARANGAAFGLDARQQLVTKDVVVDADGSRHVRFERTFQGMPVVGGDLVVHSDRADSWRGADAAARSVTPSTTRPVLTSAEAARLAGARYPGHTAVSTPRLGVDAYLATPRLAWLVEVTGVGADQTPYSWKTAVDAVTGAVHAYDNDVEKGSGVGIYVGSVPLGTSGSAGKYTMTDSGRGGQSTVDMNNRQGGKGTLFSDADDIWGNGLQSNRQSAAVDAHYGAAQTWDFFKNRYGRNGIKNDGKGASSRVHYGSNYVNAFWSDSCFCMTYGDGAGNAKPLTELDVAGHEMTHGVTSATAGLTYSGESGGINEATSDIFGTMVEFSANNTQDNPDYLVGELIDINGNGTPLRYMDRPSRDGKSVDCWSPAVGSLDVHYSSGVGNHFFYLLSEGSGAKTINGVSYNSPTCNGATVTGIGRDAASAIWYRALTVHMTSSTNYAAARAATLNAATTLYGAGSAQYDAVAAAWSAVSVN